MERFRWKKGEGITIDDFRNVESAIRALTEALDDKGNIITDPYRNDADCQYAKVNIEVIVKTWRRK